MTDTQSLIAELENATEGSRVLDHKIFELAFHKIDYSKFHMRPVPHFTGNLQHATDLIAKKLPGWGWQIEDGGIAYMYAPTTFHDADDFSVEAATPALALCIAFLKALEASNADS